jgi:hypothetical protein
MIANVFFGGGNLPEKRIGHCPANDSVFSAAEALEQICPRPKNNNNIPRISILSYRQKAAFS